jgi:hypothetical protein
MKNCPVDWNFIEKKKQVYKKEACLALICTGAIVWYRLLGYPPFFPSAFAHEVVTTLSCSSLFTCQTPSSPIRP